MVESDGGGSDEFNIGSGEELSVASGTGAYDHGVGGSYVVGGDFASGAINCVEAGIFEDAFKERDFIVAYNFDIHLTHFLQSFSTCDARCDAEFCGFSADLLNFCIHHIVERCHAAYDSHHVAALICGIDIEVSASECSVWRFDEEYGGTDVVNAVCFQGGLSEIDRLDTHNNNIILFRVAVLKLCKK